MMHGGATKDPARLRVLFDPLDVCENKAQKIFIAAGSWLYALATSTNQHIMHKMAHYSRQPNASRRPADLPPLFLCSALSAALHPAPPARQPAVAGAIAGPALRPAIFLPPPLVGGVGSKKGKKGPRARSVERGGTGGKPAYWVTGVPSEGKGTWRVAIFYTTELGPRGLGALL